MDTGALKRIKCGTESHNSEHTVFRCPGHGDLRADVCLGLGASIIRTGIVHLMLRGEWEWSIISAMICGIMSRKDRDEWRMNAPG